MKRVTAFLLLGISAAGITDILFWGQPVVLCLGSAALVAVAAVATWKKRRERVSPVVGVVWGAMLLLCLIAAEGRRKRAQLAIGELVDGIRAYRRDHGGTTPEALEALAPRYVKRLPSQGPIWNDVWDFTYSREVAQACIWWSPFAGAPQVACVDGSNASRGP